MGWNLKHDPARILELPGRLWKGREWWLGVSALAVVALCCLSYSQRLASAASHVFTQNKYVALVDGMLNPLRNRHILLDSGLPVYDLKIGHQAYGQLLQTADDALKQGWMTDDMKNWVKATFFCNGEKYDVQVRLRGDLSRHWRNPKKSYRIKFENVKIVENGQTKEVEHYFHGKRQINLIVPHDKLFALGPWVNDVLAERGLVVPESRFVVVRINGVMQGLYYEVEHFDKPLLAEHQRPETTIFGLNTRPKKYDRYTALGTPVVSDAAYDLGSTKRQVDVVSDLGMRPMQELIEFSRHPSPQGFRHVRDVMDWDKYLTYRAITTLCNTNHVRFGSDNFKLYYDPSRGLLEPLPWDVLLIRLPGEPATIDFFNNHGTDEIQRATLMDPELRLQRNRILWDLVADDGDSLMAKYDRIHNRIRLLVWADILNTPIQAVKMDEVRKTLRHNIRRTHHVLEYTSGNMNYRLEAPDRASLEFASLNFSGIRLQNLALADSALFEGPYRLYIDTNDDGQLGAEDALLGQTVADGGSISFPLDLQVLPEVEYRSDFIQERYWEFFEPLAGRRRLFLSGRLAPEVRDPLEWRAPRIEVSAVNAVTGLPVPSRMLDQSENIPDENIGITCWDASDPWDLDAIDASLVDFLHAHPEFHASAAHPGTAELSGTVVLGQTVIVPRNVPLVVGAGADVTLLPGTSVLCYGGLSCVGTPEQRIRIHGQDGQAWGTFAAVRPQLPVRIQDTDWRDGGQAQANGTLFTGGLAVHDGDAEIVGCTFTDVQSEDAINVKNGRVLMQNCVVQHTASDALDIDVGTGEVRGNRFFDIGGDAMDISYSHLTLRDNVVEQAHDKGISVGEHSEPIVLNNLILGCKIGISCKDLSVARVAHCTFVRNRCAIEAKRKKPFFGGGSGEFINCVFAENDSLHREDYFSQGQVRFDHVAADAGLPGREAVLAFVAPASGDWRLNPAGAHALEVGPVTWAALEPHPALPGIFTVPGPAASGETSRARAAAPAVPLGSGGTSRSVMLLHRE
jgi:spore coat protein H